MAAAREAMPVAACPLTAPWRLSVAAGTPSIASLAAFE
jgi:hypothetical protein